MTPKLPAVVLAELPGLEADAAEVLSAVDPDYNCVAWAAGVTDAVWWPATPDADWPSAAPNEVTVSAVIAALHTVGYVPCPDSAEESGWEKAAVYARNGTPTHVARQLPDGRWSRKLGRDCIVAHATPGGVEGAVYGSVVVYLRRPFAGEGR